MRNGADWRPSSRRLTIFRRCHLPIFVVKGTVDCAWGVIHDRRAMVLASYNICKSVSFPCNAPYRLALTHRCQRAGMRQCGHRRSDIDRLGKMDSRDHGWTMPVERLKASLNLSQFVVAQKRAK